MADIESVFVTVQPHTLNSVEEPTPVPSQEGNTKSPLLGGDKGWVNYYQKFYLAGESPAVNGSRRLRKGQISEFNIKNLLGKLPLKMV